MSKSDEEVLVKCPYCKINSDLAKFLALPENAELAKKLKCPAKKQVKEK